MPYTQSNSGSDIFPKRREHEISTSSKVPNVSDGVDRWTNMDKICRRTIHHSSPSLTMSNLSAPFQGKDVYFPSQFQARHHLSLSPPIQCHPFFLFSFNVLKVKNGKIDEGQRFESHLLPSSRQPWGCTVLDKI